MLTIINHNHIMIMIIMIQNALLENYLTWMLIKYSDRCRACTVKSVFIRAHLAEIPGLKAFRKMRINKKKSRQRSESGLLPAENTWCEGHPNQSIKHSPLFLSHLQRHKTMKEKPQNCPCSAVIICNNTLTCVYSVLVTVWTSWKNVNYNAKIG